ncbi:MAG: adenylate/guanylate cyclase domain-containing protein [Alphaproteobacteria bacterium]
MSADTEQRRLAAIMFTDMVGYGALSQRDDKLALELLQEHRRLFREIFPRFNGTEIKTIGDAFLVEFTSALEAAQCAIEIQRALTRRNADIPPDRRIEVRIGIHIGDVVHRGGDVYGDGVNIASRIEPVAGPGGICVSMDVERQIRNALEARFEKLAPTELKNIAVPMDLFRIVLPWERDTRPTAKREERDIGSRRLPIGWVAVTVILLVVIGMGVFLFQRQKTKVAPRQNASPARAQAATTSTIPEKSIAVLPFENLSSDKENAYFAEGVQDEILTRLSKVADLKVISRTTTQHFKSSPENLPEIARQLGVAHILEGSVQKSNDQVRVNVQLIKAATDAHLWAETFDRKLNDIFAVESEIAKTIADTLRVKLTGSEKIQLAKKPTTNEEAYELYLKGRFFWNKRTAPDVRKSIDYFNQAIAKDPDYALAYAMLAQAWLLLPAYDGGSPKECVPPAEAAIQKALALDETSSEAHAALGNLHAIFQFNFSAARAEFERALQLNPNDVTAHHWFALNVLAPLGESAQEVAEMRRALELDPLSLIINSNLGFALIQAGRLDEAIAQLRKTIEMDAGFPSAHGNLGNALELKGQIPEAMAEYEKAIALDEDWLPFLGHLYGTIGRKDEARKILGRLQAIREQHYLDPYNLAIVYLGLGDREQALTALEQSYEERNGNWLSFIRGDRFLDPLRGDPRFEALAEKIVPLREFKGATASK